MDGKLAKRPLTAANISPAAVFRAIEKYAPTLLIDEAGERRTALSSHFRLIRRMRDIYVANDNFWRINSFMEARGDAEVILVIGYG
jgi:hypothetical protein